MAHNAGPFNALERSLATSINSDVAVGLIAEEIIYAAEEEALVVQKYGLPSRIGAY